MKKYAFLPGAVMAVGAVLWGALTLQWNTPVLVIGAGGLVAFAVGVAANWAEIREWFRDPRGVFALNSIMTTLLLVAILGLVNAAVGMRAISFDWTAAGRNTLTSETRTLLEQLQTDVVLKQFARAHDPAIDHKLAAFAGGSARVRTGFVDIDTAPQDVKRYGVSRPGTVVAESGTRWRKIEKVTEPALATAILQVTGTSEPVICFATGEGERGLADTSAQGLSGLAAALTASNYKPDRVSLLQGDVPPFCSAVIVAGLPSGLSTDALSRVDTYLARGGRLGLLVDPPVDPALVGYLTPFGIVVGQGVVVETSTAGRAVGAGPENPIGQVYHEHPITRGFEQRTLFGRAVPVGVAKTEIGIPKPLVSTADTSFERLDLLSRAVEFRAGRDRRGPFTLAVATTLPRGTRDASLPEPRMVVVGDSDFLMNTYVGLTPNRDLALRIIAWLAGEEEAHMVSVDERQNRRVTLTERGRMTMYFVNMFLLPFIPLLAGFIQFFRSRR